MAIGQQAPPAADENNKSKVTCQTPLIPRMTWIAPTWGLLGPGTRQACKREDTKMTLQVTWRSQVQGSRAT